MYQKIIDRFEKECEKDPKDYMMRIICDHTVDKLKGAPEETMKNILEQKLTLAGAIEKMKSEAAEHKNGNYAVLTDEEGFEIVDQYFGIAEVKHNTEEDGQAVSIFDLI